MAIKGGDLLHVGESVLIERAQNAGPGQVNLSPEKVYELGNYQGIATIYDIPDLSFSVQSLDASAALESLLTGQTFSGMADGTLLDPSQAFCIDVLSEFKRGRNDANAFDVEAAVVLPYLALESLAYKFGLSAKAEQTATLKGDAIFYAPGSAFRQSAAGTNTANQTVVLTHKAYPYNGDTLNGVRYALGVKVRSASGTTRLKYGTDYTELVTGTGATKNVTITVLAAVPTSSFIDVVYASDTVANYPQNSHTVPSATRPAALRGRDIEVFVGGTALSNRWTSVQDVAIDWKVNLQRDLEFGNQQVVDQDYDVPDVTGSIQLKPKNAQELVTKLAQAAGVTTSEVVGTLSTTPVEVMVKLHSPTDGTVLKTLVIPDARITVPGFTGQVQQKLTVTMNFQSDGGLLYVYKGSAP